METKKHDPCLVKQMGTAMEKLKGLKQQEVELYQNYYKCKEAVDQVKTLQVVQLYIERLSQYNNLTNAFALSMADQLVKTHLETLTNLRHQLSELEREEIVASYISANSHLQKLFDQCCSISKQRQKLEKEIKKYIKSIDKYAQKNSPEM